LLYWYKLQILTQLEEQANLDHLLTYEFATRISPELRELQNAIYRERARAKRKQKL
jgi:hypothetical protein